MGRTHISSLFFKNKAKNNIIKNGRVCWGEIRNDVGKTTSGEGDFFLKKIIAQRRLWFAPTLEYLYKP